MGSSAVRQEQLEHIREEVKRRAHRGDTLPEISAWIRSNGFSQQECVIGLGLARAHVRRARALRIDRYIRSLEKSDRLASAR